MKIDNFKSHSIVRSTPPPKGHYRDYFEDLKKDFGGKCAYCNLSYDSITTPFEVDHFIPKKTFQDVKPHLLTDYTNLVFSCKKCNLAKRDQFLGDINLPNTTNELFYDPVLTDYNTIFYRNELGAIDSEDEKGKKMINLLKLYRPIHILGWVCEKIDSLADMLEARVQIETNQDVKENLSKALDCLNSQFRKYNRLYRQHYNDNSFVLDDMT